MSDDDLDNELVAGRVHVSFPSRARPLLAMPFGSTTTRCDVRLDQPRHQGLRLQGLRSRGSAVLGSQSHRVQGCSAPRYGRSQLRDLVHTRVRVGDAEAYRRRTAREVDGDHSVGDLPPRLVRRATRSILRLAAVDAWAKEHDG